MSGLLPGLGIGIMGAFGAATRFAMVEWFSRRWHKPFPLAIWLINVTGAFALGVLTTAYASPAQLSVRLLLGVGFLGGYTTFSTLSYESFALWRRSSWQVAWLNVGCSLAAGLIAAYLGLALGHRLG